jgi:ABC-type Zn uptake system ZnuABC Zn-binding protein ZnuA
MKTVKTTHLPTIRVFEGLAAILLMIAFWQAGKSAAAGTLKVYVVNYPLQCFAERIGAGHVNVVFPAPADVDPAYWMPDAKTISDYQQADLILVNGANYAQWSELQAMLKIHPARWMIWEGKPMNESAERLKAIGVDSLVFDPCGNRPDQGDFLSVMRQNVENLTPAFQ